MADVSRQPRAVRSRLPEAADLYAPDLGRRRKALLANWDRLHDLRAVRPAGRAPSPRALRLEVETEALAALATALTEAGHLDGPGPPGDATPPGRAGGPPRALAAPGESAAPLPAAEKRVFGAELRKALRSRAGASTTRPGTWL